MFIAASAFTASLKFGIFSALVLKSFAITYRNIKGISIVIETRLFEKNNDNTAVTQLAQSLL